MATEIKFVIDVKKLERDIAKANGDEAVKALRSLKNNELITIGAAVIEEMKDAISKGLSPINGKGRFPEYVGVTRTRKTQKISRSLSGARKTAAKKKLKDQKAKAYPFSTG